MLIKECWVNCIFRVNIITIYCVDLSINWVLICDHSIIIYNLTEIYSVRSRLLQSTWQSLPGHKGLSGKRETWIPGRTPRFGQAWCKVQQRTKRNTCQLPASRRSRLCSRKRPCVSLCLRIPSCWVEVFGTAECRMLGLRRFCWRSRPGWTRGLGFRGRRLSGVAGLFVGWSCFLLHIYYNNFMIHKPY